MQMQNREPTGRATSHSSTTSDRKSFRSRKVPLSKSSENYLRAKGHVEHLMGILRDTVGYGATGKKSWNSVLILNSVKIYWVSVRTNTSIESWFKYFYSSSLGWIVGSKDLALSPDGESNELLHCLRTMFTSSLYKFLRIVFKKNSLGFASGRRKKVKKSLYIGQTLLQGKKGTPLVSEELIEDSIKSHKENMSKQTRLPPSLTEGTSPENLRDEGLVKNMIDKIVEKCFKKNSFDSRLLSVPLSFPSSSASIERARAKGGALGEIAGIYKELMPLDSDIPRLSSLDMPRLVQFYEKVKSRKWGDIAENSVSSQVTIEYLDALMDATQSGPLEIRRKTARILDTLVYMDQLESTPDNVDGHMDVLKRISDYIQTHGSIDAEVVPLREPLKVRIITKGESIPYFVLKPFQKFLWSRLKNFDLFELIGQPIKAKLLTKLKLRGEDTFFVSGDYKNATDNMQAWVSEYTMASICKRIGAPDFLRTLATRALTGHTVKYPDGSTIPQGNGQLMGSPVSFPVLCIVNAAVCLIPFGKKQNILSAPLKVNGDDCVMVYNKSQYDQWSRLSSFVGMAPSVGKCYTSRSFLQMNSTTFIADRAKQGGFKVIPFLNFSLASDVVAKGGEKRGLVDFGSSCREFLFLAGASDGENIINHSRYENVMNIYLRRMVPVIKSNSLRDICWGLPVSLGGLGLPFLESRIHATKDQLRVARWCWNRLENGVSVPFVPKYKSNALNKVINRINDFSVPTVTKRKGLIEREVDFMSTPFELWDPEAAMPPMFQWFTWLALRDPEVKLVGASEKKSVNWLASWRRALKSYSTISAKDKELSLHFFCTEKVVSENILSIEPKALSLNDVYAVLDLLS